MAREGERGARSSRERDFVNDTFTLKNEISMNFHLLTHVPTHVNISIVWQNVGRLVISPFYDLLT
jgi:hypothetical protein